MLRAFRWNLRVLSYISLVVGAFLIYNTISVSVVRRRAEIGILRAIGAARSAILGLFLAEALLFGIAGAALGVLLGRILAGGAVRPDRRHGERALHHQPARARRADRRRGLDRHSHRSRSSPSLSAFAPAREAMRVAPTEAMSRGAHEHQRAPALAARPGLVRGASPRWRWPRRRLDPVVRLSDGRIRRRAARHRRRRTGRPRRRARGQSRHPAAWSARASSGLLAGRSLTASLSRTAVVVAALATAIAMMASVGIMVGSFRETVALWLDTQLRADLYVRPAGPSSARRLPAARRPKSRRSSRPPPGVAAVDIFHALAAPLSRRARHARRRRYGHRAPLRPPALPARRGPRRHPAQPAAARTAPSSASPSPTNTTSAPATA